jgi:dUTP pyrophosphatase
MMAITIEILRLVHGEGLPLPTAKSAAAAGHDLAAAVPPDQPLVLPPGGRGLVPTGFAIELPPGFEGQLRPRSGLAAAHAVTILNAPATVDADYRGEVKVLLINLGEAPFTITRGMRIAQLVVAAVTEVRFVETAALSPTERGSGGFGSTGVSG